MLHDCTTTQMRAARQEGRAAYRNQTSNPYPAGSADNQEWAGGWHEADNAAIAATTRPAQNISAAAAPENPKTREDVLVRTDALVAAVHAGRRFRSREIQSLIADEANAWALWFDIGVVAPPAVLSNGYAAARQALKAAWGMHETMCSYKDPVTIGRRYTQAEGDAIDRAYKTYEQAGSALLTRRPANEQERQDQLAIAEALEISVQEIVMGGQAPVWPDPCDTFETWRKIAPCLTDSECASLAEKAKKRIAADAPRYVEFIDKMRAAGLPEELVGHATDAAQNGFSFDQYIERAVRHVAEQPPAASPTMAALAAEFERRWALERAVYADPSATDEAGDAAVEYTGQMVRRIEAEPFVSLGDIEVLARLVAWAHGGIEQARIDHDTTATSDRLVLALLERLLGPAPRPSGKCYAAALIEPYKAAVAAEDALEAKDIGISQDASAIIDHRDRLAAAGATVVPSSIPGVLFQLSLANFHLHRAHDIDQSENQATFRLGQTALLNAARALSGITGVKLHEAGWESDLLAQSTVDDAQAALDREWNSTQQQLQALGRTIDAIDAHVVGRSDPQVIAMEEDYSRLSERLLDLDGKIITAPCDGPIMAALKLRVALERFRRDDGSNWTDQGDVLCVNSVLSYFTGQPSALALRPAEPSQ